MDYQPLQVSLHMEWEGVPLAVADDLLGVHHAATMALRAMESQEITRCHHWFVPRGIALTAIGDRAQVMIRTYPEEGVVDCWCMGQATVGLLAALEALRRIWKGSVRVRWLPYGGDIHEPVSGADTPAPA